MLGVQPKPQRCRLCPSRRRQATARQVVTVVSCLSLACMVLVNFQVASLLRPRSAASGSLAPVRNAGVPPWFSSTHKPKNGKADEYFMEVFDVTLANDDRSQTARWLRNEACNSRHFGGHAGTGPLAREACRVKFAAVCLSCTSTWFSAITTSSSREAGDIRLVEIRLAGQSEPHRSRGGSDVEHETAADAIVASGTTSGRRASFSSMAFDIAVVTDCSTGVEQIGDFARHLQVPKPLRDQVRILVNAFQCGHGLDVVTIQAAFLTQQHLFWLSEKQIIVGDAVHISSSDEIETSHNNLHGNARAKSVFMVSSVDTYLSEEFFERSAMFVRPLVTAYFPLTQTFNDYKRNNNNNSDDNALVPEDPGEKLDRSSGRETYRFYSLSGVDALQLYQKYRHELEPFSVHNFYNMVRKKLNVVRMHEPNLGNHQRTKHCQHAGSAIKIAECEKAASASSTLASLDRTDLSDQRSRFGRDRNGGGNGGGAGKGVEHDDAGENTVSGGQPLSANDKTSTQKQPGNQPRVLLGVVSSLKYFEERVGAIAQTWGRVLLLDASTFVVRFFVGGDVEDEIFKVCDRLRIPHGFVITLPGIVDNEYPPVFKNTAMLQHMSEMMGEQNSRDGFSWALKVDDDSIVNTRALLKLLLHFKPEEEDVYLGTRGEGRAEDRGMMGIVKPYCLGGPGYALSRKALLSVGAHFTKCARDLGERVDRGQLYKNSWHSDVIIGLCLYEHVQIGCWDERAASILPYTDIFYARFENSEWPEGDALAKKVTLHAIKKPELMRTMYAKLLEATIASKVAMRQKQLDDKSLLKNPTPPEYVGRTFGFQAPQALGSLLTVTFTYNVLCTGKDLSKPCFVGKISRPDRPVRTLYLNSPADDSFYYLTINDVLHKEKGKRNTPIVAFAECSRPEWSKNANDGCNWIVWQPKPASKTSDGGKKTWHWKRLMDLHFMDTNRIREADRRAEIAEKSLDQEQNKVKLVTAEDERIDIGITMACVPDRFDQFTRLLALEQQEKWMERIRFLVVEYECEEDPSKQVYLKDTIRGFPVVTRKTSKRFSRASNINMLMRMARPRSRFLVVDVDMLVSDVALEHVLEYVKPGVLYFPIVWSRYSPESIVLVEEELKTVVEPFSINEGTWRKYGYGMFSIYQEDTLRFELDENFVGWGGEDVDFFRRVKKTASFVRKQERGLIHVWHDKDCSKLVRNQKQHTACIGSKSYYYASKIGLMLLATASKAESAVTEPISDTHNLVDIESGDAASDERTRAKKKSPSQRVRAGWAYVCITGHISRLELDSKIEKLIAPLAERFQHVAVGLSMWKRTAQNEASLTMNQPEKASSLYTLTTAKEILSKVGGASAVHINKPVHDSTRPFDVQLFRQMNGQRGQREIENDIRQLEGLAACQAVLDTHAMLPEIVVRVDADALVVHADVDTVLSELSYQKEKMMVITSSCATRHGMNSKIAALSGSAAKVFFTAPRLQYARSTLASWVRNMETFYLDTYMSNKLLMETTSGLRVLTVRLEERPHDSEYRKEGARGASEDSSVCMKFVPYGTASCERAALKRLDVDAAPCANGGIARLQEGVDGAVRQQTVGVVDDAASAAAATTGLVPKRHLNKLAYVCISGQLARLELKSKIEKLIEPLQQRFEEVHVALSVTTDAPRVDAGAGLGSKPPSSPHTVRGASQRLMAAGVAEVHTSAPPPLSASRPAISSQYAAQLDKKLKSVAYRHRRAENDMRQFEALHNCATGLKTLAPRVPDIVVRLRDDSYVVRVDVDVLLEELELRELGRARPAATLVTQRCASHGGLNDKFAAVTGRDAIDFFAAPLDTYNLRPLPPWVKNPETYYLDTYMRQGFQLMTSSSISVITTQLKRWNGCWKFVPAGEETCEKRLATEVLASDALPCLEVSNTIYQ